MRSLPRTKKISIQRNASRLILLIGDLGGAAFIGERVLSWLPNMPVGNHVFQVWLIAIIALWFSTYDIDKKFTLDIYLTYTRILKIAFFAALAYLLFFVLTRSFYSLSFLICSTGLWLIWAILLRWLLTKFSPPPHGLALTPLPLGLPKRPKVKWHVVEDPDKVKLIEYDFLLVDFSKQYGAGFQELLSHAHVAGVPIFSLPQMLEHLTGKIAVEHLNKYFAETTFYVDAIYLRFKRFFDIVLTVFLLPLILPLILLITISILIFMGRPIFYWQQRMGLDDKVFNMLKFRTMVVDAQKVGDILTQKNDQRITRLGAWLRKWRLDELPQFFNVIKGDMSIIGPRPEQVALAKNFMKQIPLFQLRHWLRPGITGWAQVMHGYASNEDEMLEKVRYDMFYLKNLSIWLDLIILFRTVLTVLTGFGSR